MLVESDVIDAACAKLKSEGYQIRQQLQTTEHGDDIIAVKQQDSTRELHIEAKGETSSRKNSKRYGKLFEAADMQIHIAEALYKAAEILSKRNERIDVRVGIALPDNRVHRALVKKIEPVLNQLQVAVFWVEKDCMVQVESNWML